ncbi:retrovirus-related pol polyprotein from transposon TNT 1-94 [Tanacetum coccineum]
MEPRNVKEAMTDPAWIDSMQGDLLQFKRLDVDEENTIIRNKTRLGVRGYHQEEGIDFEESFALVAMEGYPGIIFAYRAYTSFNRIPNGHDIIFGSTNPRYNQLFADLMKSRFEMSMIGEMTFFLGLQVNQSPRRIFINQSNYVLEILKKFKMETCDPIGTPMEIKDKLDLDKNGTLVNVTKYRGMIGADKQVIMDPVMQCTTLPATQASLKRSLFHFSLEILPSFIGLSFRDRDIEKGKAALQR